MLGMKPNPELWRRMNLAALNGAPDVNAGELIVTIISAAASVLLESGICATEPQARAHLAAMLLSPDTGQVGDYLPLLQREFARLRCG